MESRIVQTDKTPEKETWLRNFNILEWIALALFVAFLLLYFSRTIASWFGLNLEKEVFGHETWGVLGDFVGGVLGTFIAYISVRLLVKTLKNQIEANNKAADINKETSEVYRLQQFNEQFKILFSLYQETINLYNTTDTRGKDGLKMVVTQLKEHGIASIKSTAYEKRQDAALDIYKDFYVSYHSVASVHFRLLYRIFQLIDSSKIPDKNRTEIAKIMRCQLSADELLLLRYNAIASYGEKMRSYINTYNLLKHLPLMDLLELSYLSSKLSELQRHSINTEVISWRKETKRLLLKNKSGVEKRIFNYSGRYSVLITVSNDSSSYKIEISKLSKAKDNSSETNISKAFDALTNDDLKHLLSDFTSEMFSNSNFGLYNKTSDLNIQPEITDLKEQKKTVISLEVKKTDGTPLICSQRQLENPIN